MMIFICSLIFLLLIKIRFPKGVSISEILTIVSSRSPRPRLHSPLRGHLYSSHFHAFAALFPNGGSQYPKRAPAKNFLPPFEWRFPSQCGGGHRPPPHAPLPPPPPLQSHSLYRQQFRSVPAPLRPPIPRRTPKLGSSIPRGQTPPPAHQHPPGDAPRARQRVPREAAEKWHLPDWPGHCAQNSGLQFGAWPHGPARCHECGPKRGPLVNHFLVWSHRPPKVVSWCLISWCLIPPASKRDQLMFDLVWSADVWSCLIPPASKSDQLLLVSSYIIRVW